MSRISDTELIGYDCISLDYNEKEKNFSFEWKFNISREFDKVVLDTIKLPYNCVAISLCVKFSGVTTILDVAPDCIVDFNGCNVSVNGICEIRGAQYNNGILYESHYEYYYDDIKVNILNHSNINTIPYVFVYLGELAY